MKDALIHTSYDQCYSRNHKNSPVTYRLPENFEKDVAWKAVADILAVMRANGLTFRQSQTVLDICKDRLLDYNI